MRDLERAKCSTSMSSPALDWSDARRTRVASVRFGVSVHDGNSWSTVRPRGRANWHSSANRSVLREKSESGSCVMTWRAPSSAPASLRETVAELVVAARVDPTAHAVVLDLVEVDLLGRSRLPAESVAVPIPVAVARGQGSSPGHDSCAERRCGY